MALLIANTVKVMRKWTFRYFALPYREPWVSRARAAPSVLLGIIFYTNFLDYLLLTAVVPIIPEYLVQKDRMDALADLRRGNQSSVVAVSPGGPQSGHNKSRATQNVTMIEALMDRVVHVPVRAISENGKVGWLLSSKAIVQLGANTIVGALTGRIKYRSMMIFGTCVFLFSSMTFAIADAFIPLLVARASQGFGSAATTIAGMSLLAESYSDDKDRSRAMGTAMGGLAFGILVGYPFGGLLYAVAGKPLPFVGIAVLCVANLALQAVFLKPDDANYKAQMGLYTFHKLLTDPYIVICAVAIMLTSMSLAVLESTVPIWVMDVMGAEQWQLGLIFIPDSIGYLLGTNLFAVVAKKYGRWRFTIGSLFLIGAGMILIPFSKELVHLLAPHLFLGLGVGVADAAIMPLLALMVDQRHVATYGSVYAIVQLAVCLAYSLGPSAASEVVRKFGFKWCMWGVAGLNLAFMPFCLFLRSPPIREDQQCILDTFTGEECSNTEGEAVDKATEHSYNTFDDRQEQVTRPDLTQ